MIRKIDWWHWQLTDRVRVGFFVYGRCWRFKFECDRYTNETVYGFWRFFLAIRHPENTSCET